MSSRLYEQLWRNDFAMAPEKNFKLLKYEHITYGFEAEDFKYVIAFEAEDFKYVIAFEAEDFKYVIAFAKYLYFAIL